MASLKPSASPFDDIFKTSISLKSVSSWASGAELIETMNDFISHKKIPSITFFAAAFFFLVFYVTEGTYPNCLYLYWIGANIFVEGGNPYAETLAHGAASQYKYSPFFAIGIDQLRRQVEPMGLAVSIWCFGSIYAVFSGTRLWITKVPNAKSAWFAITIAAIAAVVELYVSMTVKQANALVLGLTLLGLFKYKNDDRVGAGVLLMLATFLKVYPVIFLAVLCLYRRKDYLIAIITTALVLFLIPAFFVGWRHNLDMHVYWLDLVLHEANSGHMLDIEGTFNRLGMHNLGQSLKIIVVTTSFVLFPSYLYRNEKADWRPWISLGLTALLLLSPKTEVYTYVFMGPVYLFLTLCCLESSNQRIKVFGISVVLLAAILTTSCRFIVPNWFVVEEKMQILRVIPVLAMFAFSAILVFGGIATRLGDIDFINALKNKAKSLVLF